MLILSTPHNLQNRYKENIQSHILLKAKLDGTKISHSSSHNCIMIAAVAQTQEPQSPTFIEKEDSVMDISPSSPISTASTHIFSAELMTLDAPETIPIFTRTAQHTNSFSWDDFPILTENILYVDSARQQRLAPLREMEGQEASKPDLEVGDENDMMASNNRTMSLMKLSAKFTPSKTRKTKTKSSSRRRISRSVHFDTVHIREHTVTLGDQEWCEGALAVTLDWPHSTEPKSMLIQDYESMRERQGRVPRGRLPKLEHWQRKQLLQRVGGLAEDEIDAHIQKHVQDESAYSGLSQTKTVPNLVEST